MMEISDNTLAKFVNGICTRKETEEVLKAAAIDHEIAKKIIVGFLVVRFLDDAIENL